MVIPLRILLRRFLWLLSELVRLRRVQVVLVPLSGVVVVLVRLHWVQAGTSRLEGVGHGPGVVLRGVE